MLKTSHRIRGCHGTVLLGQPIAPPHPRNKLRPGTCDKMQSLYPRRTFGSLANSCSKSPMALRTDLMIGLPFRVLRESRTISWKHDMSPLQSVGYKTPLVKSFREGVFLDRAFSGVLRDFQFPDGTASSRLLQGYRTPPWVPCKRCFHEIGVPFFSVPVHGFVEKRYSGRRAWSSGTVRYSRQ